MNWYPLIINRRLNVRRLLFVLPYRLACCFMYLGILSMSSAEQADGFWDEWWS